MIYRKQTIRHPERSEESLRVQAEQNKEGFLASLGMTKEKTADTNDAGQMTPRLGREEGLDSRSPGRLHCKS
jgi:hypothetical protein